MAILSSTGIAGFLSSARATGKQILNKAGKLIPEFVEDFKSGFLGNGWKIWEHQAGKWMLEIDALRVRGTMTVFELLISKIRAIKGAQMISQGCGRIKTVELSDDKSEFLITLEDKDMSFVEFDFIRCQTFDGTAQKLYHVEISSVENNKMIHVALDQFDYGYDEDGLLVVHNAPEPGDDIVQFGNGSDDEKYIGRHSAIYMHADETGQPAIDVLDGIYSKDWSKCLTVRVGGDIPGGDGKRGFYCVNGMIKCESKGHVTYCLHPDGTAELGDGSALFKPDKSGHIAGGAISWRWDETKEKCVCTMKDVVLTWENLDEEAKENLKGDKGADAVVYELALSTEIFVMNALGRFTPDRVIGQVRKTNGAESVLMSNENLIAEGLSLGWIRDDSGFINISPGDSVTPHSDCFPIVFHLKRGDTFICSKTVVTVCEGSDGKPGEDGTDGVPGAPGADGKTTYTWIAYSDNADGSGIYQIPNDNTKYIGIAVNKDMKTEGTNPSDYTWSLFKGKDGADGRPGEDANLLPWVEQWNNNKTLIDGEYVVSPKMFSGTESADGKLTGIAQGKECITIDGVKRTGIFALVDNEIVFELDPITKRYLFKGRVEADGGYFKGKVEVQNEFIRSFKEITIEEGGKFIDVSTETNIFINATHRMTVANILPGVNGQSLQVAVKIQPYCEFRLSCIQYREDGTVYPTIFPTSFDIGIGYDNSTSTVNDARLLIDLIYCPMVEYYHDGLLTVNGWCGGKR